MYLLRQARHYCKGKQNGKIENLKMKKEYLIKIGQKSTFLLTKIIRHCLICKEFVQLFKNYNLKRHYTQKHAITYDVFIGICRKNKITELKTNLSSQQIFFKNSLKKMKIL